MILLQESRVSHTILNFPPRAETAAVFSSASPARRAMIRLVTLSSRQYSRPSDDDAVNVDGTSSMPRRPLHKKAMTVTPHGRRDDILCRRYALIYLFVVGQVADGDEVA